MIQCKYECGFNSGNLFYKFYFQFIFRSRMKWSDSHDIVLLREILLFEPWVHKFKTEERAKVWCQIAESLNSLENILFQVTDRSIRERYGVLEKKFKQRDADEIKASGIAPKEPSEKDIALQDIMERFREAELLSQKASNEKVEKAAKDAKKGEEMRLKAAETFASTKKRHSVENGEQEKVKRSRRTGNDTLDFLKERSSEDLLVKKEEMALRRLEFTQNQEKQRIREQEMRAQQNEAQRNHEAMIALIQNQQHQQNIMMQQQMESMRAMIELMKTKK